ncbi:Oligoendopeptidase F [Brachybacterium faecium]|nr:Oligoendopeptidase F [Brachybacterium faecium]
MAGKAITRSEVPVKDTWDLTSIFETDDAWETEFKAVQVLAEEATKFQKTLGDSADQLLAALKYSDELVVRLSQVYVYASMKHDQDTSNTEYQALNSRAESLAAKASAALSFFEPELLDIDEAVLAAFISESDELGVYAHELEQINKKRPHTLSAPEEALLAKASEVLGSSQNTFGILNNADLRFPTIKDENGEDVEITHGLYGPLLENSDRRVRRDAFQNVYKTYKSLLNTFASTLTGQIKQDNFNASVRKFNTARESAVFSNNIPESVHKTLLETVGNNVDLLHRYVSLRKQVLGLDELHVYDLYTPLVADVDELSFTYEEAKQVTINALAPLGEEYVSILKEGFDKRWVDVVENKGKRSGAYSGGSYGTNPFILLNWHDTLDNLYTLVHEFGHSVHSYLTRKNQPAVYGDYTIFLAEIASTTNENLLTDYLLKKYDDKKIQAYIINHFLDGFKGTVFRQTQFAEFEHLIHVADQEGNALTAEYLTDLYYGINKKYYGDALVHDEEIGNEWARIPHFYYNYYVYQYATGFSAASALAQHILDEGAPAVERYMTFLKAGNSDYPIDVLKAAGVDMTTAKPIEDALKVFEARLAEFEAIIIEK